LPGGSRGLGDVYKRQGFVYAAVLSLLLALLLRYGVIRVLS
jgi:hypothetical protein